MKEFHMITYLLVIVGALNWGIYGVFSLNLVHELFGGSMMMEKLIYILVGVSAVAEILTHKNFCTDCGKMMASGKSKKGK